MISEASPPTSEGNPPTLRIRSEVFDHVEVVHAALGVSTEAPPRTVGLFATTTSSSSSSSTTTATTNASSQAPDSEQQRQRRFAELLRLCALLRESAVEDGRCTRRQIEQFWGVKAGQLEVLWSFVDAISHAEGWGVGGGGGIDGGGDPSGGGSGSARIAHVALVVYVAILANETRAAAASRARASAPSPPSDCAPSSTLLRDHVGDMIRLVLGVPQSCAGASLLVGRADVDDLGILIAATPNPSPSPSSSQREGKEGAPRRLSDAAPCFAAEHAAFEDVAAWLRAGLASSPSPSSSPSFSFSHAAAPIIASGERDGRIRVVGVHRTTVAVRPPSPSPSPPSQEREGREGREGRGGGEPAWSLVVSDCTDATIYCPVACHFALVRNCKGW